MDFFANQPHPETNETACVDLCENAEPLKPLLTEEAICCACAYFGGLYQLLVVLKQQPDTVWWYQSSEAGGFSEPCVKIKAHEEIVEVSWLLRADEPLICVHAGLVYFYNKKEQVASLEGKEARLTAYHDGERDFLVGAYGVYPLDSDGESCPVKAMACRISKARQDTIYETKRSNPGTIGGRLFKNGDKLHYICADVFNRCARENVDTFICQVDGLKQSYSRRYLAIPNGGAACLFEGAGGQVFAAFIGATANSAVHGKVAILPLEYRENAFFRPAGEYLCETAPSALLKPRGGIDQIRDSFIYAAPDGYYYLTGTTLRENGSYWSYTDGIKLWKSKDLEHFTYFGKVFDYLDTPQSWQNHVSNAHNCWAPEMIYHADTFWLTYSTAPGCGLLKSESGLPQGPYIDMGRVVMKGIDSGFFQEEGRLYLVWQNGWIAPLAPDGRTMLADPVLLLPIDGQEVGYEGAGIIKVQGKYVLYAAEWNGDARIDGTYDMMYSVSDQLMGPYTKRRILVPHGGHGCLFYDFEGNLNYTLFGNDRTAPFRHSVGIGQVHVSMVEGELLLRV